MARPCHEHCTSRYPATGTQECRCARLDAEIARAESLPEADRLRRYGTEGLALLRSARAERPMPEWLRDAMEREDPCPS